MRVVISGTAATGNQRDQLRADVNRGYYPTLADLSLLPGHGS
jgi:hypothetical protein